MEIRDSENQFKTAPINFPPDKNLIILVGGNNSGKSTLLRSIAKSFGNQSYAIGVNRTVLRGEGPVDISYLKNWDHYIKQARGLTDDNTDRPTQTLQDYFKLKDAERLPIIEWYNQFFPNNLYEEREDPENSASPLLLKAGGFAITKQGSGMRSTLEVFIKLFDPSVKVLCIDEPEIGLEPILQKYLLQAIKEKVSPDKKVIIATHSHHFLDYETVDNNYICKRDTTGKIEVEQAVDLKPIIFRLLGNTLGSVLLPEKILVLEGPSDTTFLRKCLDLLGKNNYAIHGSGGDGNIKYAVGAIGQFLRFHNNLAVYNESIYVIVDKPTRDATVREWQGLLSSRDHCKVLPENGIEYFYPENILQTIFNTPEPRNIIVTAYLAASPNGFNGINLTKNQLSQKVAESITGVHLEDPTNELFNFLRTLP